MKNETKFINKILITLLTVSFFGCTSSNDELKVIDNNNSEELTFILELDTKGNSIEEVVKFTQYLSEFIVQREPSIVYGYYISEDGQKVTLIERYLNSQDGIQHGIDFINGPNFNRFFEIFEIKSFITIGDASDQFKNFALENGFDIEYRESIGGYVRR